MDRWATLTTLGLIVIAGAAGGALVGLTRLLVWGPAAATLVLVAGVLLLVAVAAARSRPQLSTPYWE